MYFDSPSARIKETQQILDRLEKRLEKYYKPVDTVAIKSEELVNLKAKIIKNINKNDTISKSPSQQSLPKTFESKTLTTEIDYPKKVLQQSKSQHTLKQVRELKKRIERVESRHKSKQLKLQRKIMKLKTDLEKSIKLNNLLIKQLSPMNSRVKRRPCNKKS